MSTLYENKTNNETNALPVNAKIKVFVIVPIISLPISIPESKICFWVKFGWWWNNSDKAETIDIPTSIIAPNDEIKIPANKISLIDNPVAWLINTRLSASSTLKPLTFSTNDIK